MHATEQVVPSVSQLGVETKFQKSAMLGRVVLLLLQTAFVLAAAYGAATEILTRRDNRPGLPISIAELKAG